MFRGYCDQYVDEDSAMIGSQLSMLCVCVDIYILNTHLYLCMFIHSSLLACMHVFISTVSVVVPAGMCWSACLCFGDKRGLRTILDCNEASLPCPCGVVSI